MATISFKGTPVTTSGDLPEIGSNAPNFKLTAKDLPFASARFCSAEGIDNVESLSDFRDGNFGKNYGLTLVDGPLAALHSRCVIVLNDKAEVIYTEQVSEITEEPNYEAALDSLS